MVKIYQDDNLTIYQDDYRNIIKDIEFDYIITDPPYNRRMPYKNYYDVKTDEVYNELLKPLKDYKCCIIHHIKILIKHFCIPNNITPIDNFVWCYNSNLEHQHRDLVFFNTKPNKSNVKMEYLNKNCKRIQKRIEEGFSRKMTTWFNDIGLIMGHTKEKVKNFRNQIPIKLYERIILLISKENDTLLDCFAGTGNFAIACKNLNRKCILIEQNHIDILMDNLKNKELINENQLL